MKLQVLVREPIMISKEEVCSRGEKSGSAPSIRRKNGNL